MQKMQKTQISRPDPRVDTRVERIRERLIHAPEEVCVERARYLTESMSQNWDRHALTRMSLALENILNKITVVIRDDELVVGARTSKLKGAPLFPENKARWMEGDLDTFEKRVLQPALITDDEREELRIGILPFWKGKTVEERFEQKVPPDVFEDIDKYIFTMILEINYGVGHFTMDHAGVLKKGLAGVIDEAGSRLESLTAEEMSGEKGLFYEAVIRSARAAISFAQRYSRLASQMAENTDDPARAEELRRIAEVCSRVPEHPARTFHEAVQCVYFIHLIAQIESGGNSISLGRIDTMLAPYYDSDIKAGAITPEQAKELLSLLFLKTNEIWNVLEEAFIPGGEGAEGKTTQNVVVGGLGRDGEDATSPLSYIGLDAFCEIATEQPNFGVRVSSKTPADFFLRASEYATQGVPLHFFNDEAIIDSLVDAGHDVADARDYGMVGCLEPNAQGKSYGSTFAVQFNGIKCLELALSDGIDNIFGYQSGLKTGDPASFTSFDEVWEAYEAQVSHFIGQVVKGMAVLDEAIADLVPSPFASAMIEGPLEKGIDLTRGGAVYNSTGVEFIGFANTADSLYSVRKVIFEDGKETIADLARWMAEDWMDAEDKQRYFLTRVPKYGNDIEGPDEMAARVLNHFCDELARYRTFRKGAFWPGVFSVGFHLAFGSFTGGTPDGRWAGDVLGNGLTPTTGNAVSGATAVMNSITRLPLRRVHNGANLNMRFPGMRTSPEILAHLIRAYFENGGFQVQFNMVDTDTLKDAQTRPERHRDLVVRVSGYSALFIGLSDTAQDEIISRTEFELN